MFFYFLRYVCFFFTSGNAHSIHSPFIFNLYTRVIHVSKPYYAFKPIARLRKKLLKDSTCIEVTDLGAGSLGVKKRYRTIASITGLAQKPQKHAELLFRLILHFKANRIVDLGTSLGLTTQYLASASTTSKVYTFEGCPVLSACALNFFKAGKYLNIIQFVGNIDATLPQFLNTQQSLDLVFFDANHRYLPTINYFRLCLGKAHENSVFVFDDIHWSREMEQAWKEILAHPEVTLTVDLFYMGLVFFRKGQPKQHFKLRF